MCAENVATPAVLAAVRATRPGLPGGSENAVTGGDGGRRRSFAGLKATGASRSASQALLADGEAAPRPASAPVNKIFTHEITSEAAATTDPESGH